MNLIQALEEIKNLLYKDNGQVYISDLKRLSQIIKTNHSLAIDIAAYKKLYSTQNDSYGKYRLTIMKSNVSILFKIKKGILYYD